MRKTRMFKTAARRSPGGWSAAVQALLLVAGLSLLGGCGEPSDRAQTSGEFLLVYSGDFRGFFEPCG